MHLSHASHCEQADRISSLDARLGSLESDVGRLAAGVGSANGKLDVLVAGLLPTHQSGLIRIETKWGKIRGPAAWVGILALAGLAAYARAKGWL